MLRDEDRTPANHVFLIKGGTRPLEYHAPLPSEPLHDTGTASFLGYLILEHDGRCLRLSGWLCASHSVRRLKLSLDRTREVFAAVWRPRLDVYADAAIKHSFAPYQSLFCGIQQDFEAEFAPDHIAVVAEMKSGAEIALHLYPTADPNGRTFLVSAIREEAAP
jgi:hypothetical protein